MPVVQADSLMFGQGQEPVQRPDMAQPGQGAIAGPELKQRPGRVQPDQRAGAKPGQRPDMTVGQNTGRVSPDHSQSVGGAGGGPEELSRIEGSSGVEKRLESGGYNPVVLSAPVQKRQGVGTGVEQRAQPGLGYNRSNIESQVDVTLPGLPVDNLPLHMGARIRTHPDKYQAGQ